MENDQTNELPDPLENLKKLIKAIAEVILNAFPNFVILLVTVLFLIVAFLFALFSGLSF